MRWLPAGRRHAQSPARHRVTDPRPPLLPSFYNSLVGCKGPDFEEQQNIVIFLSLGGGAARPPFLSPWRSATRHSRPPLLTFLAACLIITILLYLLEEAGIKLNERRRRKEQKRKRQEQIRAVESRRHDSVFVPDDHDTSDGHDTNDDHDVNTTTV